MKTVLSILSYAWLLGLSVVAQPVQSPQAVATVGLPDVTQIRTPGPHSQLVLHLAPVQNSKGQWYYQTNKFLQIESGLNYQDSNGQWAPSQEVITVISNGATAWNGQHKVTFGVNLNSDQAIQLRLPDNQLLISHVAGLAYFDSASGQSVMIAPVQDDTAWLLPPNQVLYVNAFQNIEADVRYTYTKAGFEQDIILRACPPSPTVYGLNPATTRLEVWTEFVSPPAPVLTAQALNWGNGGSSTEQATDWTLDFGSMVMGSGKAFAIGAEDESLALVAKSWVETGGRTFLIEAVAVDAISSQIQTLPPAKGGASLKKPSPARLQALREVPAKSGNRKQVQSLRPVSNDQLLALNQKRGVVLDYSTIINTLTNYTFQSDTTYYITGPVTLSGTNSTFEGGTVIKYANTNTAKLVVNTPLTWGGAIYRPVILTASDDQSVGEVVRTNAVSGYYADTALDLEAGTANTTFVLGHLRVSNAKKAIVLNQHSGHILSHVQLVNCQNGINPTSADFSLRNALFYNVLTNFNGSSSTNHAEHLTVDTASWFNGNSTFTATNLLVTNSLLIAVADAGAYTGTSVSTASSPSGLFQSVAGGSHYLASHSSYRNAGVTNISPALAADFKQFTTYPPTVWSTPIVVNTTLHPQVQRDTDIPDTGYHYPALDYYSTGISVTGAALTVTNGTAIAVSGSYGILLQPQSSLVSWGLPQQLNVLTRYSAVTEQPIVGAPAFTDAAIEAYSAVTNFAAAPAINCQFTSFTLNSPGVYTFFIQDGSYSVASLTMGNCQIYGGELYVVNYSDTTPITLNNNFHWRAENYIQGNHPVSVYNQLFKYGVNYFYNVGTNSIWTIRDNVFDTSDTYNINNGISYSNNAYIATNGLSQLLPLQTNDIVLSTFTYASATNGLGPWYHGQSNLVNQGSRTADLAGLYHDTTQTSQVKETNSIVDIGFHYVAVDASGNPLDTNGNGIPDYLEDGNGNGSVDSGETRWQTAGDLGFKVLITEPKPNSNLP